MNILRRFFATLIIALFVLSLPTETKAVLFQFDYQSSFLSSILPITVNSESVKDSSKKITVNPETVTFVMNGTSLISFQSPFMGSFVSAKSVKKTYIVTATAYSSTVDQTDSTPFITASGTHVRDGIIAANFLPMGAVVRIPDVFGDKTFIVEDRMNRRYQQNIDIWFPDREQALTFGIKKVVIEVI